MAAPEGIVAWLGGLNDTELADLLARRTDLHRVPPATLNDLGARLSNPWGVEQVLGSLDRTAAQVGAYVSHLGGRASVRDLSRDLGLTKAGLTAALDTLAALGLAWPVLDDKAWRTVKGWDQVAARVLGWGSPISRLVEHLPLGTLRAALRELDLGPARSTSEAQQQLTSYVQSPDRLSALLDSAPQPVIALLEILVTDPYAPVHAGAGWVWLQRRCLAVRTQTGAAVCAEVLRHQLGDRAQGWVAREPHRTTPASQVPAPVDQVATMVSWVRALLTALQERPVKALRSGGIGVQEQRRLAKAVGIDESAVSWLLDLAGDAGLLTTGWNDAGRLTAAGTEWLRDDEEGAYAALVVTALDAPDRSRDQAPLRGIAFGSRATPDLRAVANACRVPAGSSAEQVEWLRWRWYGGRIESLAEQVRSLEVLGLVAQGRPSPWLDPVLDWDLDKARRAVAAALPSVQETAVFQADGTAFVGARPSGALRSLLELLGVQESERTWRLSAAGVRQAFDDGWTCSTLLSELEERSKKELPQVLQQLVRDVADKHGRIKVIPSSTLLQVADVPLALELARDKKLASLGLVEVQPGVLASTKKAAEVLAALRKAGHAPVGPQERPATAASRKKASVPIAPVRLAFDPAAAVVRLRQAPTESPAHQPAEALLDGDELDLEVLIRHLPRPDQQLLLQAYEHEGAVEIDYVDRGGRRTTRVIEAIEVEGRLLNAWCRLRDDERNFDPDSITAVRPAR